MPVSETKRRNNDKYNAKCDRITVWPIKAKGAAIRAAAKENGRQVPPAGVSNVFFGTRKFNSSSFFWRYLPWWSLSQR